MRENHFDDGRPVHDIGASGFAQRIKALALTKPLHSMDDRKVQVQTADYSVYQMAELGLQAIDLVTIAMDFDTGAHPEKVATDLTRLVAEQAPDRGDAEHARVASWVLENLLNAGSADRGFRALYGTATAAGYDLRTFDFKLLEETLGGDGERYLRATNEAVNVLVGALEVDIESAQIAADLRLEVLVRRGQLINAEAVAQSARFRTIQYGERLREQLEATSRDVRNVDWLEAMPKLIDEAVRHVGERYQAESAIMDNLTVARDTADTAAGKAQAAHLIEIVRDCLRRHDQLSAALQGAGRRFRREQDRQTFNTEPVPIDLDLNGMLLRPALTLPIKAADPALDVYFRTATGFRVPRVARLADLFDQLITPPVERDLLGDEVAEPDLDTEPEPERFSAAAYDALDRLLALDEATPVHLSDLLAHARADAARAGTDGVSELDLLTVVRVLARSAEEIGPALRHGKSHVLVAVDTGRRLDDPEFAGADLLVARAAVAPAAATAAPSSATDADTPDDPSLTADQEPAAAGAPAKRTGRSRTNAKEGAE